MDAWQHHLTSLLTLHPDDPVTETEVLAESTHHGVRSRVGQHRTDLRHHLLDPVVVAGPWLVAAWLLTAGVRRLVRRSRH